MALELPRLAARMFIGSDDASGLRKSTQYCARSYLDLAAVALSVRLFVLMGSNVVIKLGLLIKLPHISVRG